MRPFVLFITSIALLSCNSFHELSKTTKVGHEDSYVTVYNDDLKLVTRTFGDISLAFSKRDFKAQATGQPKFRDVLFYGSTDLPAYEYYVLLDPMEKALVQKGYSIKDTLIGSNRVVVLVSHNAPTADKEFLFDNIRSME